MRTLGPTYLDLLHLAAAVIVVVGLALLFKDAGCYPLL